MHLYQGLEPNRNLYLKKKKNEEPETKPEPMNYNGFINYKILMGSKI